MRTTNAITAVAQHGTVVASGGTTVATGVDWTPTYEPSARLVLTVGASAAGAVVCTAEQGTAVSSGYATVGTLAPGSIAGVYSLDLGDITRQFLRTTITASGGTAAVTANLLGKARTIN